MSMYECDSCGHRFQEPKRAYSFEDGMHASVVVTSDDHNFSEMEYLHRDSWEYCPKCGSDMIVDLNDIE